MVLPEKGTVVRHTLTELSHDGKEAVDYEQLKES